MSLNHVLLPFFMSVSRCYHNNNNNSNNNNNNNNNGHAKTLQKDPLRVRIALGLIIT